MSDRLVIRLMAPGEVDTLREIDLAARSRYRSLSGLEKFADAAPIAPDRFALGLTFVACEQDRLLGFAIVQTVDGMAYLANISVVPEVSGVGASLLQRAEREAEAMELPAITLTTFKEPRWNGPWFRRHGFSTMPAAQIGPGLRVILQRHATLVDMTTRDTLWKQLPIVND